MFDIGFWELTVIAVVALLVVGPEELPTLARTAGRWVGKVRRFMSEMKDELESEVDRGKELKERIAEETKIADAHRVLNETTNSVSAVQKDLRDAISGDLLKPIPKAERERIEPESEPEPVSGSASQGKSAGVIADDTADKKEPSNG